MENSPSYNQEKFEKSLEQINFRSTIENQRQKIKERFINNSLFPFNGGFFKLSPELLLEIKLYIDLNKTNSIILDINYNPIKVDDLKSFFDQIRTAYFENLNDYEIQLSKLNKSRQIATIVNLHEDIEE